MAAKVRRPIPTEITNDAELRRALLEIERRKTYRRLDFFKPYPKQFAFFEMGLKLRERLFMAGNQLGKSEAGAFETSCHLTGMYPDWWPGRKWDRAVRFWAAGETSLVARDVMQKKLCGEPGVDSAFGSGMIPKDCFVDKPSLARGITDAYDSLQVRHVSGGVSVLRFKSYEQGRAKFQGETLDGVWCDEEPDKEIYAEVLTRVAATEGMVFITFTPINGKTDVVNRFMDEPSVDRGYVTMTIDDAGHISAEQREKIVAGYLPYEREARARGVPMLGSGRVFQVAEEQIKEPPMENVPVHWAKLWGIDFGIGHPFGAVLIAWDRDTDVIHVVHALRIKDQFPVSHVAAMRPIGSEVPVAWPHDGNERRDQGKTLAQLYGDKVTGLKMLETHAQFPDGGFSTEAGLLEMEQRFMSGRLKVANHLTEWFEEYREYHRKDGKLVKIKDDLMSATRMAVMMRRRAKPMPLGLQIRRKQQGQLAADVDFDVFA